MNEKTLLIVESPSKAKKIGQILGDDYVVRASVGHIADLAKNGEFNLGIDLQNGFKTNYAILPDKTAILDELMILATESKEILLGSDFDREGAAIAQHLYSRLSKCGKPFKRILMKEITEKGIRIAIKNKEEILSESNLNLYASQEARRVLDRIVGFMASPFLMSSFGSNLSAGRVQSVVTRMIIDREREIETFKPETYFTIKANLTKDKKQSFWAKLDEKVIEEKKAQEIKTALLNSEFTVKEVLSSQELKKVPPPMITSQLQKVLAKSFGLQPEETMTAAQSLYEQGYISYHRTDSVRSDPDAITELREYLTERGFAIPKTPILHLDKSETSQGAHEAIRPTHINLVPDNGELSGDQQKVYEIIWKYFTASQMNPAIYDTLKLTIAANDHQLKASGKALRSKGFLEIMGVSDDSKIDLPALNQGDQLFLKGKSPVVSEKKETQPPPRYTNYSLIEQLEKKQIGRPATYAQTISTITQRNYVSMEGTTYRPTELGKKITDVLSKSFSFMDYGFTASMEKGLDLIEAGKQNYLDTLTKFFEPFKKELTEAYFKQGSEICDCGNPMTLRKGKDGNKFWGCLLYPRCYGTRSYISKMNVSEPLTNQL